MGTFIDLTGKKFGEWSVIRRAPSVEKKTFWLCVCSCGTQRAVEGGNLRSGITNCCGCINTGNVRHGKCRTRIYSIWNGMFERCYNPNSKAYKSYGGRGIKVCDSWNKFEAFFADMGERPDGKSLDRINNDAGYGPENCRWATRKEQNNNKRNNRKITYGGKTLSIGEWRKSLDSIAAL